MRCVLRRARGVSVWAMRLLCVVRPQAAIATAVR